MQHITGHVRTPVVIYMPTLGIVCPLALLRITAKLSLKLVYMYHEMPLLHHLHNVRNTLFRLQAIKMGVKQDSKTK